MLQEATKWSTKQKFITDLVKEITKVGPTKITLTPHGPEGCVHMQGYIWLGENRGPLQDANPWLNTGYTDKIPVLFPKLHTDTMAKEGSLLTPDV